MRGIKNQKRERDLGWLEFYPVETKFPEFNSQTESTHINNFFSYDSSQTGNDREFKTQETKSPNQPLSIRNSCHVLSPFCTEGAHSL